MVGCRYTTPDQLVASVIPPVVNNFVAGESPAAVCDHVASLNERGVAGIVNLLGEHYDEHAPADADTETYVDLLELIADRNLDACVSVKPSQIGIGIDESVFSKNLSRIVDTAQEVGGFVWIDMEDHTTTDATLDAFERQATATGGRVGVCVQANLRRTSTDLERLADLPGKVRLVKGAYDEPADVAYEGGNRVDEAFQDCLEYMFREFDDGIAVGSHDPEMVEYAAALHEDFGTPYEVQMLTGVREDAQFDLAADVDVYQYVPYGSKWFSYFYRRIRERRENALFALKAVLRG